MTSIAISETVDLETLADEIRQAHRQVRSALSESLAHAIAAGQLLIEAKKATKYGNWLGWLEEKCELAERTAQMYMRIARQAPQLLRQDPQRFADLTVRSAGALLAKRKSKVDQDRQLSIRVSASAQASLGCRCLEDRERLDPSHEIDDSPELLISDLTTFACEAQKAPEFTAELRTRAVDVCRRAADLLERLALIAEKKLGMPYVDVSEL
jgi:Protein of unknown function (DUF3102)